MRVLASKPSDGGNSLITPGLANCGWRPSDVLVRGMAVGDATLQPVAAQLASKLS